MTERRHAGAFRRRKDAFEGTGPGTKQGLCNHALLAVLLGSGLRISEVLNLDRDQYTGKGFAHVQVKGGQLRDVVPVQREARAVLNQWLDQRGGAPGPIFPTRTNRRKSPCL